MDNLEATHKGVKLRKTLTSGPRYGCDHCGTTWKKPAEVLILYIPDQWSQDYRASISFCFGCAGSLGRALIQLSELKP